MEKGRVTIVPLTQEADVRPAIIQQDQYYHCQRCGTRFVASDPHLLVYCRACARFKKVTIADGLKTNSVPDAPKEMVTCAWKGQLTSRQAVIATRLITGVKQRRDQLVWAVTGAGKTEMMFPVIESVLAQGKRVVICSPRIDVCRELYPRIQAAFPDASCLLLYGDSKESYRYTRLMVCTTHQLLHFYHAFDLLILDEADAFPYEGDRMLFYAQQHALKPTGTRIFLTATPSSILQKNLTPQTQIHTLPERFHKRPLPVPDLYFGSHWEDLYRKSTSGKLIRFIRKVAQATFTLVFCPSIALVEQLGQLLAKALPEFQVETVHAQDGEREEIVHRARMERYQILVTTTILERGVTFEQVSVVVLAADHQVYTKSTLVQIAGRVDRKGTVRCGEVWFLYRRKTRALKQALREIHYLNQLAKEQEDAL